MAAQKKKVAFRGIKTEQVIRQYKRTRMISYALYALVVFFILMSLNFFSVDRLTAINLVLCIGVAAFAVYVLHNIGDVMMARYLEILRNDCDPYKFEALYSRMETKPDKPNDITFNICRAIFYQGRFQEALDRLKAMGRPKENSVLYFQYYNLLACCYDELDDVEKLVLIKEKVGKQVLSMKEKDKYAGNGRQLLIVLDQLLTQKEGRISRSREICEEILEGATFTLSRIQTTCRLAELEYQSGAGRSAMEHAAYVIDDGGRTFYVDRAREIYKKCCGKDYVTEEEQFKANLAAGMYSGDAEGEE